MTTVMILLFAWAIIGLPMVFRTADKAFMYSNRGAVMRLLACGPTGWALLMAAIFLMVYEQVAG